MRHIYIILIFSSLTLFSQTPDEFNFLATNSSGTFLGQVQVDGVYADARVS